MNRKLILNIGLAPSTLLQGSDLDLNQVIAVLALAGFTDLTGTVKQSGTELTAVIECTEPSWVRHHQDTMAVIYSVAMVLRQEAIAWCEDRPVERDRCGWLHGPHAQAWGDFSYDHFLFP